MSKPRSQTIRIFLPDGNPRGVRRVERSSNSNIRLFDIPRSGLGAFCQMSEAAEMGIYFLLSSAQLYIGQTSDLGARLKTHDKTKPFWQRAFAVVLNNDFRTLDHLYCLEKTAIEQARAAGRFELDNGTAGSSHRHLHDSIRSDCENIFDEIETLLAVLNQEWFTAQEAFRPSESLAAGMNNHTELKDEVLADPQMLNQERPSENAGMVFYCRRGGGDARGFLHKDGKRFVVMAGSLIQRDYAAYAPQSMAVLRRQWLSDGILTEENPMQYRLNQDCVLSSISYAALMVIGKNANGRTEWKTAEGKSFAACYPKMPEK